MTERHFLWRRKAASAPAPSNARLSLPVAGGSFVAEWPEAVSAAELKAMRDCFSICMNGWIAEVEHLAQKKSDADIEYASWFSKGQP